MVRPRQQARVLAQGQLAWGSYRPRRVRARIHLGAHPLGMGSGPGGCAQLLRRGNSRNKGWNWAGTGCSWAQARLSLHRGEDVEQAKKTRHLGGIILVRFQHTLEIVYKRCGSQLPAAGRRQLFVCSRYACPRNLDGCLFHACQGCSCYPIQ